MRAVQAAVLQLLQPFSASLDKAPVNKTERLHRSYSSAVIGCAVALLPPHICLLPLCMQKNTEDGQDADRSD